MGNTTYLFAFDEASKAAIPDLATLRLTIGKDLPIPLKGDFMSFEPLPSEWFAVTEWQFAYVMGNLTITLILSLAPQG